MVTTLFQTEDNVYVYLVKLFLPLLVQIDKKNNYILKVIVLILIKIVPLPFFLHVLNDLNILLLLSLFRIVTLCE